MTFEKVLDVFKDFLLKYPDREVVVTSRGRALLDWDNRQLHWECAEHCGTPVDLMYALLSAYKTELEYDITLGEPDRFLTEQEKNEIDAKRYIIIGKCMEVSEP